MNGHYRRWADFWYMEPNTGSFAGPIGGSQELLAAMQRRGIDASALQQVSPGSVGGASPVPAAPEAAMASAALGGEVPVAGPAAPAEDSELKIALKALSGFVQSEGKLRRDLVTPKPQGIV